MPQPTLIRARATENGGAVVRVLMTHAMDSGQRKDAEGRTVPAWHIQHVTVSHNGRTVLSAQWGPSISKDPYLQFTLRRAQPGDMVAVSWVDNRGESRGDEARIS